MPKKAVEEDSGPSKAWLDSYADAMTLLLAFFVLLYAFSITDESKFAEFKYGVEQAFSFASPAVPEGTGFLDEGEGIHENAGQVSVTPSDVQNEVDQLLAEMAADQQVTTSEVEELLDAIEAQLAASIPEELFDVDSDPRGVIVTLDERLLFASGSAAIDTQGAQMLSGVAAVLAEVDNEILVAGHTDSIPTNGTRWPSNWELSAARATSVLRVLTEGYGIAAPRLSAVGHADTRPRDDNSTAVGRQANRRTELVVLIDDGAVRQSAIPLVDDLGGELPTDPLGLDEAADAAPDIVGFDPPVFTPSYVNAAR